MHLEKKEDVLPANRLMQETKNTLWQTMQLHFKKYALAMKAVTKKDFYLMDQYDVAYKTDHLQEIQRCRIDIKMSLIAQADRISELPHKMMIYGKHVPNDFFLRTERPKVVSSFHLTLEDHWKEYLLSLDAAKAMLAKEDIKAYILSMLPSPFTFEGHVAVQYFQEGIIFVIEKQQDYNNIFDMVTPLQDDPYLYFSKDPVENSSYCVLDTAHLPGAPSAMACICVEGTSRSQRDTLKKRALQSLHNRILSPEEQEDAIHHVTHYTPYTATAESILKDTILVGIAGNVTKEEDLYHFAVTSQHPYEQYISAVDHECLRREEKIRSLQIKGELTPAMQKEHADIMKFWSETVQHEKKQFEQDAQEYIHQACTIMNNLSFHPRVKKLLCITPLELWRDLL